MIACLPSYRHWHYQLPVSVVVEGIERSFLANDVGLSNASCLIRVPSRGRQGALRIHSQEDGVPVLHTSRPNSKRLSSSSVSSSGVHRRQHSFSDSSHPFAIDMPPAPATGLRQTSPNAAKTFRFHSSAGPSSRTGESTASRTLSLPLTQQRFSEANRAHLRRQHRPIPLHCQPQTSLH